MTDTTQPAETPAVPTEQVPTTPDPKPVEPAAAEAPTPAPSDDPAAPHDDPGEIPADETQPKKKKGGGFQDRINELTKKNYEKDFEIERLQRELRQHVKKPDLTADPGPEPTIEQFRTVEEFVAAHRDWARHEGYRQSQLEARQHAELEAMRTATAALRSREDAAAAKYPDYEQTVAGIAEIVKQTPVLSQYVLHSELAPDVAYHLAKNPVVLSGLLQQDQFSMVRELTRLEAKLSAAPPPKPLTNAPAPIKPVGARESVPVTLGDLAKSHDIGAYVAKANARGKP